MRNFGAFGAAAWLQEKNPKTQLDRSNERVVMGQSAKHKTSENSF
jgi:hypothetical protein